MRKRRGPDYRTPFKETSAGRKAAKYGKMACASTGDGVKSESEEL